MHEFNQSLKYDRRMYDADVRGSVAYAKALSRAGILTQDEMEKIIHGLSTVGKEWMDGIVSSAELRISPSPQLIFTGLVPSEGGRRGYTHCQ